MTGGKIRHKQDVSWKQSNMKRNRNVKRMQH